MIFVQKFKKLPNKGFIVLFQVYRLVFSPSVGIARFLPFYPQPTCIFHPTCSEYAIIAFKKYPFFTAFIKTVTRIGRCHPGNTPAIDHP